MDDKEFAEVLKALGKDKKVEDEAVLEIPSVGIKAVKKRQGKTYYEKWLAARDESEKL